MLHTCCVSCAGSRCVNEYIINCCYSLTKFLMVQLLSVEKTPINIGDSSFAVAASVLWNALPCQIKKARTIDGFKSMLKPHLFKL